MALMMFILRLKTFCCFFDVPQSCQINEDYFNLSEKIHSQIKVYPE